AGSLLVLLVWVYYSAEILFFGAEFTQVYARRYGSRIEPSPNAVPLTEDVRANRGVPRREAVQRATATGQPVAAVQAEVRNGNGRANGHSGADSTRSDLEERPAAVKKLL